MDSRVSAMDMAKESVKESNERVALRPLRQAQ